MDKEMKKLIAMKEGFLQECKSMLALIEIQKLKIIKNKEKKK